MGLYIGVVIGYFVAWVYPLAEAGPQARLLIRRAWAWLRSKLSGGTTVAQAPTTAAAAATASASATAATEPLTARLHALETGFAPYASNYAHPRELEDNEAFKDAAALLRDEGVPLFTVLQYALGANWALSCAALEALCGRADRNDDPDEVLAHFDKLNPWAMHFALEYLLATDQRTPVGAVVVAAPRIGGART